MKGLPLGPRLGILETKWFFRKYEKLELLRFRPKDIMWHLVKFKDIRHELHHGVFLLLKTFQYITTTHHTRHLQLVKVPSLFGKTGYSRVNVSTSNIMTFGSFLAIHSSHKTLVMKCTGGPLM